MATEEHMSEQRGKVKKDNGDARIVEIEKFMEQLEKRAEWLEHRYKRRIVDLEQSIKALRIKMETVEAALEKNVPASYYMEIINLTEKVERLASASNARAGNGV